MRNSSKKNGRCVILRDDDTNAFTPPECLERLYRPFLDRGLPVNLATIPEVRRDLRGPDGRREGFLPREGGGSGPVSVAANTELVEYLRLNAGFHVVQHGWDHSVREFDSSDSSDIRRRLDRGTRHLAEAGFPLPGTFVAPYDVFSRVSVREAARRFRVLSTGWVELRRLPWRWWVRYLFHRTLGRPHLRIGRSILLTHPGCLLSYQRPLSTMLEEVQSAVMSRRLTVLVTHWWEYFREGSPDARFIGVLHEVARWLAGESEVRVVSFDDVARGTVPLF